MAISVREALQLTCLREAEVVSGHGGLDNMIENVNVIEMPDGDEWLESNVLILTAFHAIRDDGKAQLRIIKKMAESKVPALMLAPEFYLEKLNDDIIRLSNKLNFPIIKFPPYSAYSDVIKPVLEEVFKETFDIKQEQKKRRFLSNLLNGKYKDRDEIYRVAGNLDLSLLGLGTVIVIGIELLDINRRQGLQSKIYGDIIYELSLLDNLMAFNNYEEIVVLPIICDSSIRKPETLNDLHLKIANNIKAYIKSGRDYLKVSMGIGRYYGNILDIDKSYREAQKALNINKCMPERIILFQQLKIYKLLTKIDDSNELNIFYKEILYPLDKYDMENGTNFTNTLKIYFECNENMQITAEKLFIHINTIKYRINRIKEILGIIDFTTSIKLELYLAIKIKEILD